MAKTALFKIGGSILDNSKYLINTLAQLTQLFEDSIIQKIVLIPGGGNLANFVRSIYSEFKLKDDLTHWIAIYSMNFNGLELQKKFPHLELIDDLNILKEKENGFIVFLPYKLLKTKDPLPHNWDVTSDSITAYIAYELELKECFLIKDVDGILDKNNKTIKQITPSKFKIIKENGTLANGLKGSTSLKNQSKPVDNYLITLIEKYFINCILINGKSSKLRIFNYFSNDDKSEEIFTKISVN